MRILQEQRTNIETAITELQRTIDLVADMLTTSTNTRTGSNQ